MTIGIGVLCCTKPKIPQFTLNPEKQGPRPDALVMIADTMGSTDYDSTDDLHKMYVYPEEQLYGTCAGNVDMCGEIIEIIRKNFREMQEPKTHGSIYLAINNAVAAHRSQHFQTDVLLYNHLPVMWTQTTIQGQVQTNTQTSPQWQHEKIERAFAGYDTNTELLVGTFDHNGRSLLYFVGRVLGADGELAPGLVHPCLFPGFRSIGIGSRNANFWFKYRRQVMGNSVKQSAYHAYEAKVMAANAPTVNDSTEMLIAINGQDPSYFSETLLAPETSPVSLPELKEMFLKYGPQNTRTDLGHPVPKRSVSRKSKG